jgi:hypothetical protein
MTKTVICGIYKITNKINNKSYIGQSKDIYRRWREHIKNFKDVQNNQVIYLAIRKYGLENFDFSIVEECALESLDEREIFYIEKFNTYIDGYNMTIGGSGQNGYGKSVDQYTLEGKFIQTFNTIAEAENVVGDGGGSISECCIGVRKTSLGYLWCYHGETIEPYQDIRKIRVSQYDLRGNFIKSYNSATEAANAVSGSKSQILFCCHGKCKSGYGYQWTYEGDTPPSKYRKYEVSKIYQYALTGEYIKCFDSCEEASEETELPMAVIYSCCSGNTNCGGNFIWSYEYSDKVKPYTRFKNDMPVVQYYATGEKIQEFDSIADAVRFLDKPRSAASNICYCCQGKRNKAYGYIWRYKEDS